MKTDNNRTENAGKPCLRLSVYNISQNQKNFLKTDKGYTIMEHSKPFGRCSWRGDIRLSSALVRGCSAVGIDYIVAHEQGHAQLGIAWRCAYFATTSASLLLSLLSPMTFLFVGWPAFIPVPLFLTARYMEEAAAERYARKVLGPEIYQLGRADFCRISGFKNQGVNNKA